MAILRIVSILCGVLAVLALGSAPAPVMAETMPCHEQGMPMQGMQMQDASGASAPDSPAPSRSSGVAMACCVMCVVSPLQEPAAPSLTLVLTSAPATWTGQTLAGLAPAPASPPPRLSPSL